MAGRRPAIRRLLADALWNLLWLPPFALDRMQRKIMGVESDKPSFEGDAPAAAETQALPDRRELALVAVERTRMPMVVSDPRRPDNPIVLANSAFLALTGYDAEEVLGRNCRFLQGPGTDPADVDAIRRGLAGGDDHVSVVLLNYRKDGSAFWNDLAISPITDENGALIYYFASQQDVTERRRIEQMELMERQLLMEVDHRAMNALALVQSILHLTRADTVGHYSSVVLGRVGALARAHRLLAQSGWAGADLKQLIRTEVSAQDGPRVEVTGDPSHLPATLVQPLALVLHELMSNARKHGALASGGHVSVSWMAHPGTLTINWTEHGGPDLGGLPKPGFGLRTLVALVEKQLGGAVDTSWARPGFSTRIRVPISTAAPTGSA